MIRISIIIATFNRAHLISESLESIIAQSFKNWECIIIDDGSTDNTLKQVEKFTARDQRVQYLRRPHSHRKGLPGCRNYGLEIAKGQFVIFIDDDDIIHPYNLEICINQLENYKVDFCHFNKQSFNKDIPEFSKIAYPIKTYPIGINKIEDVITNKIPLASCTVLWRKKCFKNEKFIESLHYAEEWECYSRVLLSGFKGIGINEVLYFNRKHPNSNTGEFWNGNVNRMESYVKAVKLVIDNLRKKGFLSQKLIRHFVQMSIFYKNKDILNYILQKSDGVFIIKFKYRLLFKLYPVLGRGYRFKKLLKNRA
ncbi:glycosyltransferase family 2 protein [Christiangramia aquimixticola]|uniref:glycosyltransferase family 2 protein n=1 Tax=Christiangramia aquimixticola TaxID=1697558 RepID=UPI003AA8235B